MTLRVLDLFSGIGGFSIGLERAGMRTVAFCEIDPYCRAVLRKHWPAVPCHDDIRTFAGVECDVICGGFPCQGFSTAGQHRGHGDDRSGLWAEFARLIGDLRPSYAIVENVSTLKRNGLSRVLGDLAEIGYDTEWHCIPASAIGAPHRRDRIWIVAYPEGSGGWANAGSVGDSQETRLRDTESQGHFFGWASEFTRFLVRGRPDRRGTAWEVEPGVGRLADGIRARVQRTSAVGNAVVPQIPEIIGRAILTLTE